MAKVNTKQFEADMKLLLKDFGGRENMQEIGDYAADRIRTRTRLGKGVSSSGAEPEQLKPLSEAYRDQRKADKKKSKLSSATSPAKSNLTRTGKMLDSISVSANVNSVLLFFKGSRERGGDTNAQVAGYVSEDRPFFNLSKPELTGLNRFIRDLMEKIVKRNLT